MSRPVGNPQIGQWYQRWDTDELFQVTGLDEEADTIELQDFHGDLSEVELESWRLLPLTLAEPPQPYIGQMDDSGRDDAGAAGEYGDDGWGVPPQSQEQILERWERRA